MVVKNIIAEVTGHINAAKNALLKVEGVKNPCCEELEEARAALVAAEADRGAAKVALAAASTAPNNGNGTPNSGALPSNANAAAAPASGASNQNAASNVKPALADAAANRNILMGEMCMTGDIRTGATSEEDEQNYKNNIAGFIIVSLRKLYPNMDIDFFKYKSKKIAEDYLRRSIVLSTIGKNKNKPNKPYNYYNIYISKTLDNLKAGDNNNSIYTTIRVYLEVDKEKNTGEIRIYETAGDIKTRLGGGDKPYEYYFILRESESEFIPSCNNDNINAEVQKYADAAKIEQNEAAAKAATNATAEAARVDKRNGNAKTKKKRLAEAVRNAKATPKKGGRQQKQQRQRQTQKQQRR